MNERQGICYLVGAGPGDPDLITIRGMECLRQAERVYVDRLVNPALLREIPSTAEWRYVGKVPGGKSVKQEEICKLLIESTRAGFRVVRLKGGDPFIFGRGGEEVQSLAAAGLRFEVIPGVSAAIAAAAYAGIPASHRGLSSQVTFVSGHKGTATHTPPVDWSALAKMKHTLCIYMGVARIAEICRELIKNGRQPETPAAVIRNATLPDQHSVFSSLGDLPRVIKEKGISSPAIIFIGETVALHETCSWFSSRISHQPSSLSANSMAENGGCAFR